MTAAAAIATLGGLGRIGRAPGTVASFVSVLAAWAIAALAGPGALLLAALVAMAVGGWAAELYSHARAQHDPSDCVIDEVAGQLLACAFAPRTLIAYVLAFVFFRALDIFKPWPIGAAERFPGGLGIIADDVVAGLLAGLAIVLLVQARLMPP